MVKISRRGTACRGPRPGAPSGGIAQDQAEMLQRAMVREFGGDPAATDSTRVLRLPEFVNRKYETEHVVRAQPGATQTYHLEDFRLRTDLQETPAQFPKRSNEKE